MDRGAWRATVHRVAKIQTQLKLPSMQAHIHYMQDSVGLQSEFGGILLLETYNQVYKINA